MASAICEYCKKMLGSSREFADGYHFACYSQVNFKRFKKYVEMKYDDGVFCDCCGKQLREDTNAIPSHHNNALVRHKPWNFNPKWAPTTQQNFCFDCVKCNTDQNETEDYFHECCHMKNHSKNYEGVYLLFQQTFNGPVGKPFHVPVHQLNLPEVPNLDLSIDIHRARCHGTQATEYDDLTEWNTGPIYTPRLIPDPKHKLHGTTDDWCHMAWLRWDRKTGLEFYVAAGGTVYWFAGLGTNSDDKRTQRELISEIYSKYPYLTDPRAHEKYEKYD